MLLSNCIICGKKKSKLFKNQNASSGLLSQLRTITPLRNIPLIGGIIFY